MRSNLSPQAPLSWRQALALTVLFALLLFVPLLFGRYLESGDETRVAGIAAEMALTGEWFIPRLNGVNFLEYPPLFYWCAGGLFKLFGITDGVARLTALLFAAGAMLLLLQLARKLRFSPTAGLIAVILLGTSAQFFGNARKCTVDIALAFFVLLTVTAFVSYVRSFSVKAKCFYLILTAAGFAGGILTKGILGAGVPAVILGGTRVLNDIFVFRKISWKRYFALALAFLAGVGGASLYYLYFYFQNTPESQAIFHELFVVNNFGRFSGSQGDHVESVFYYFEKLPTLFAPYTIVLLIALYAIFPRVKHRREMFLVAALLLPFCLFCAASSKRVVYLLPSAPFAALLATWLGGHWTPWSWLARFTRKLMTPTAKELFMLTVAVALALMLGNLILNCFAPDETQAELFARCRELEQQGYQIELAKAPERTRGGAVFYLRHTVKTVAANAPQAPHTARVMRTRETIPGAETYPDRHVLIVKAQ